MKNVWIACPACEKPIPIRTTLGPIRTEPTFGGASAVSVAEVHIDRSTIEAHVSECPALQEDEGPGMTLDELLGKIDDVLDGQP